MEAIKEKEYIMYKIICNTDDNLIYIGSTTNFKCRKSQHNFCCNDPKSKKYNLKIYENIRNNGGWENWIMKPIEIYNTDNKIKAKIRENQLMEEYKSNLNCIKAYINYKEYQKEYRGKNIDKNKNYQKDYRVNNTDENKKYQKEYKEKNKKEISLKGKEIIICECGCKSTKYNLNRHKKSLNHIKLLENIII